MRAVAFGVTAIGVAGALAFAACGDSTFLAESNDAGGDASGSDVQLDVVSPDGSGLDGGSPLGCTGNSSDSLCDDFDESGSPAGWWGKDPSCENPTIVSDFSVSNPNALLASTDAIDASCSYLTYSFAHNTHVTCAFDILLDEFPSDYTEYVTLVIYASSVRYYQVALALNTSSLSAPAQIAEAVIFNDGGVANDGVLIPGAVIVPSKWTHISLELDLAAQHAAANIDGVIQPFTLNFSPPAVTLTEHDLRFGLAHSTPTKMRAHYDNVTCSAVP